VIERTTFTAPENEEYSHFGEVFDVVNVDGAGEPEIRTRSGASCQGAAPGRTRSACRSRSSTARRSEAAPAAGS
jgi:hypothetical protein